MRPSSAARLPAQRPSRVAWRPSSSASSPAPAVTGQRPASRPSSATGIRPSSKSPAVPVVRPTRAAPSNAAAPGNTAVPRPSSVKKQAAPSLSTELYDSGALSTPADNNRENQDAPTVLAGNTGASKGSSGAPKGFAERQSVASSPSARKGPAEVYNSFGARQSPAEVSKQDSSTAVASSPGTRKGVPGTVVTNAADIAGRMLAGMNDLVRTAQSKVIEVEKQAKQACNSARAVTQHNASAQDILAAEERLQAERVKLVAATKALDENMKKAQAEGAGLAALQMLTNSEKRLRALQQDMTAEIVRFTTIRKQAEEKKLQQQKELQAKESEREAEAFEEAWSSALLFVQEAEDAVDDVVAIGSSIIIDVEDDINDEMRQLLDEIDNTAKMAHGRLLEAKKRVTLELNKAQKMTSELRPKVVDEFSKLQTRIKDMDSKLEPFRRFKLNIEDKRAGKKLLREITAKLSNVELDVEKAHLQVQVGMDSRLSVADMKSIEELLAPVDKNLKSISEFYEQKLRPLAKGDTLKQELNEYKDREMRCREKLAAVLEALKTHRERQAAQQVLTQVIAKVEAAEEELVKSSEAEMPFLKGIEDLPYDEAAKAIKDCEAAAEKVQTAINESQRFLLLTHGELRRCSKDLGNCIENDFNELQERNKKVVGKLKQFQLDTEHRKEKNLLQQITRQVSEAEKEIEAFVELASGLTPKNLDEVSLEDLIKLGERTSAAEQQSQSKFNEVWKTVRGIVQACDDKSSNKADFLKLQARLNTAYERHVGAPKVASEGRTSIEGKNLLQKLDAPLESKKEEFAKLRASLQSWQDQLPSEEEIAQVEIGAQDMQVVLDTPMLEVSQHLDSSSGALKAALAKRRDSLTEVTQELRSFRSSAEMQRQRLSCEAFIAEAVKRTDAVDAAMVQVSKAELPFFKGIEILPVAEAEASLSESDKAQALARHAFVEARSYISAKCTEVGQMREISMDTLGEHAAELSSAPKRFQELEARVDIAEEKFRKMCVDTQERKRSTFFQKVNESLSRLESEVGKLPGTIEVLTKSNAEEVNMEKAGQVCKDLAHSEQGTAHLLEEVQAILTKAHKEMKGANVDPSFLTKSDKRRKDAQVDFAKAQITLRDQEQFFVANKLRLDARKMLRELEEDVAELKKQAEPLLVDGGATFIVAEHLRSIGSVLKEHARNAGGTQQAFQDLVGESQDGKIAKEAFLAYLEALPDKFKGKDLNFSEAQRKAIFVDLDVDKDGYLTSEEFQRIFSERYVCIHGILVTDRFDIKEGKTLTKLEVNDVVETCGDAEVNGTSGLTRVECKLMKSGTKGWVTMKGNQGTPYLEPFLPYAVCVKSVDKLVESTQKKLIHNGRLVKYKIEQLSRYREEHLLTARADLLKVRTQITDLLEVFSQLKGSLAQAKKDYVSRMEEERRLQKRACGERAADAILKQLRARASALEENLQKLRDAAKPLMSRSGIDRAALEAPLLVMEAADSECMRVTEEMDAMTALLSDHKKVIVEAPDSPMYIVKLEMAKVTLSMEAAAAEKCAIMGDLRRTCISMATRLLTLAVEALRKDMVQRGVNVDTLFSELAGGENLISEDAFCKQLMQLNAAFPLEHWRLLFRHIEAGGISLNRFRLTFQQFNQCVRGISITTEFDIGKGSDGSTKIRLLEDGEVVEVLEGPISDKHLTRIRAAALRDGQQGWISVQGSQGTVYLKGTSKPYYLCTAAVSLDRTFRGGDAEEPLRMATADEAFEVLEGPRAEKACDVFRARGKASKDGAGGWFTVRTQDGEIFAQPSDKYWMCIKDIAMTDARDIKSSNPIRKVEAGETCLLLEGPFSESNTGQMTRIRCKSLKDKQIGWITVRGNAGTTFAEQSTRHYRILSDVPLQATFHSQVPERIRVLSSDEVIEVSEGPHVERFDQVVRVKGRFLADGVVGWMTQKDGNLKAWSPWYSCSQSAQILDKLAGGKQLRNVKVGEKFEVFEGPRMDAGALLSRVRAEEDGLEGWIIIRDDRGNVFFDVVLSGQH